MARYRRTRRRRSLGAGVSLLGARRKSRKSKARKATACKTAKGKLRKGWRFGKGGRCIKAKSRR